MDDQLFNNAPFDAAIAGTPEPPLGGRNPRFDNEPPLEERVMMELMEELDAPRDGKPSIAQRIEEITASAGRVPETIDTPELAGAVGDLIRIAGAALKEVDAAREKHNRPLLTAQRCLKAKADAVLSPMNMAVLRLRNRLNDFVAEQERVRREERRKRDEEAQRAREALERENIAPEVIAEVVAEQPRPERAPVARGDYGSTVGTRTVWKHEIQNVRQVPDQYLKHPKVVEALGQVVGAAVRSGVREIKGVRIWDEQAASVR